MELAAAQPQTLRVNPVLCTFQQLLPLACHIVCAAQYEAETGASCVQQRAEQLTRYAARDPLSCMGDVEPTAFRQENVRHLLPRYCA